MSGRGNGERVRGRHRAVPWPPTAAGSAETEWLLEVVGQGGRGVGGRRGVAVGGARAVPGDAVGGELLSGRQVEVEADVALGGGGASSAAGHE